MPSVDQKIIVLEQQGSIRNIATPGASYGYGTSYLKLLLKKGDLLFIKIPGSSDWSGRGETSYYPPSITVARVKRLKKGVDDVAGEYQIIENKEYDYTKKTKKEVFAEIDKTYGIKLPRKQVKTKEEKERYAAEKKEKEDKEAAYAAKKKEDERKSAVKKRIVGKAINFYAKGELLTKEADQLADEYNCIKEMMKAWGLKLDVTNKEILEVLNLK